MSILFSFLTMSENPSLLDQIIHEAQNPNPLDTMSLLPQ